MVLFFTSAVHNPAITLYMGRDKVENRSVGIGAPHGLKFDVYVFGALFAVALLSAQFLSPFCCSAQFADDEDLIKYAYPGDIWFHVDKLSSAHVYLRLPEDGSMAWETIPEALLIDCAQLVKANSIEGNKKDNLTIIYTPADNLKKTGDMAVGQVSFHSDKRVKRVHIAKRENPIVNRLNKTKVERVVDHEQDRIDREKRESAVRRAAAAEKKKADMELARTREAEKAARSYDTLFNVEEDYGEGDGAPKKSVRELEEDFM